MELTDLELVDEYIVKCQRHVNPGLFNQVRRRGLYDIINFLPTDIQEAKAVARARLAKQKKYFGEPEIDAIFQEVSRIENLRTRLNDITVTDVDKLLPILEEMTTRGTFVRDYFKTSKLPE